MESPAHRLRSEKLPSRDLSHLDSAKILVIDDNPINLLFLRKLLKRAGWMEVQSADGPESGFDIARIWQPDLIITDLHMPGIGGMGFLDRIRSTKEGGSYLPVLVYTADITSEARRQALDLGASDFLTKPGDPDEIVLRVRNFLQMRHLYRQLEDQNGLLEQRVRERTRLLEEAQMEIVQRLALAGDFRDDDTGEHCRRVGDLSWRIALAYGLSTDEADLIRMAAPLHDIGKVALPDAILKKSGKLDFEERDLMQRHVTIGASILADSGSELLRLAHVIALHHHERWDGTGYGQGLAGEAIPIAGRIVALADVFDALTSNRPYKTAWTTDEAIREIERSAGSHFDPAVVAAFLQVMSESMRELAAA